MSTKQRLIIHKFGGSCIVDETSYAKTIDIIQQFNENETATIVVLSAFKGVTDQLLKMISLSIESVDDAEVLLDEMTNFHVDMAERTIATGGELADGISFVNSCFTKLKAAAREVFESGLSPHMQDYVVSFGECISTYLFACYLKAQGMNAAYFSGESLIMTTSEFGNAMPLMEKTRVKVKLALVPALEDGVIPIVTGFFAENEDHLITTLGRGGSDFSATIIANALADEYEPEVIFWKDVDGLLTANPTIEPDATLISEISYDEAKELAFFGSKILHPVCLRMAMDRDIPVQLRNFCKTPDMPYTTISKYKRKAGEIIKSIACLEKCTMITLQGAAMVSLPGIAARLFAIMAREKINIILISQASSENNITFVVSQQDGKAAVKALKDSKFFGKQWFDIISEELSLIAAVGHGMAFQAGVAGKIFTALGDADVNVRAIAQGSSELNISILIDPNDLITAVHAIHEKFIKITEHDDA
ncbi:MAG TPA: aspartate kinase [Candidatus Lokiarchaeia archaeon]|nr:aspartate kinase [Candidatus Lokiarchaeia archaeon]